MAEEATVVICLKCGKPCEVIAAWPFLWVTKCCGWFYTQRVTPQKAKDMELERLLKNLGLL